MFLRIIPLVLAAVAGTLAQAPDLLPDEAARVIVEQRARERYENKTCFDIRREESLESSIFGLLPRQISDGHLTRPVFFFQLSDSICYTVGKDRDGKEALVTHMVLDGDVTFHAAVTRDKATIYWFHKPAEFTSELNRLFRDLNIRVTNELQARTAAELYRSLVPEFGSDVAYERQLKRAVEDNFASAWAPYGRDGVWEKKFDRWWRRFQNAHARLSYEPSATKLDDVYKVSGLAFIGYTVNRPPSDGPPNGKPAVVRWNVRVDGDGVVTPLKPEVVFAFAP